MTKYRKKPVVIDAWRWDETKEMLDILEENGLKASYHSNETTFVITHLKIHTSEGTMDAIKGDYIIKGIKGEFYPVKEDIFEATYEKV